MPWEKTPASRKSDAQNYGAEYRRNRPLAMQRDQWRCQLKYEGCAGAASECDHINGAQAGHALSNLQAVCGPCHGKKTARQGGGFRKGSGGDPEPRSRTNW